MKRLVLILTIALAGCVTNPVCKDNVVTVNTPIATIPQPPEVPEFVSQVDQLTAADAARPGVVGKAYKYDMTYLRGLVGILKDIVKEYQNGSHNFGAIEAEINRLKVVPAETATSGAK